MGEDLCFIRGKLAVRSVRSAYDRVVFDKAEGEFRDLSARFERLLDVYFSLADEFFLELGEALLSGEQD